MSKLKRIVGATAALTLAVAGTALLGSAAQATLPALQVTAADIQPTETPENYTSWHNGAAPGGKYGSTTEGLEVLGKAQIIKGETALPAATALLDYAKSSNIEATGGPVWHQIGFGLSDGTWTTLRAADGAEGGDWTTSKALNGVAANGSAPLDTLLGNMGDKSLTYLSGGFYVDPGVRATVSSYSVNAVTTSFELPAMGNMLTKFEYISADEIRPDETEYLGWHNGAAPGGSYVSTADGLKITGKVQVLKGEENSGEQFAQFVTGQKIVADGPVWYQVPVFYGESNSFTTLRATPEMAAAGTWQSSRAIPGIAAGQDASVADIALALGKHRIIGHGFFVDSGKIATVQSYIANGVKTTFTPFVPDTSVPGVGAGQADPASAPAAVGESVALVPGSSMTISSPPGVFKPASSVRVIMHSDPIELGTLTAGDLGIVDGTIQIPADAPAGVHRIVLQSDSSYYWLPTSFTIAAGNGGTDTGNTGGGNTGNTGNTPGAKAPGAAASTGAKTAAGGSPKSLANTGADSRALLIGGAAALLGAGAVLMLSRRRSA